MHSVVSGVARRRGPRFEREGLSLFPVVVLVAFAAIEGAKLSHFLLLLPEPFDRHERAADFFA